MGTAQRNGRIRTSKPNAGEISRLLWRFSRPHKALVGISLIGTIGVVLTRLALPWPLRALIETVFPGGNKGHALGGMLSGDGDYVVILCCLAYLVLAASTGFFEFLQRVWVTRFVGQTVQDMRNAALIAVEEGTEAHSPADLIARVVGDSARLKASLKNFLIQIPQNGLMVLGITILFLCIAPKLGLLLLGSSILAIWLGRGVVDEVMETSLQQREQESLFALRIHHRALAQVTKVDDADLNHESSKKQGRGARLVYRMTAVTHVAVAAMISVAIYIGVQDVRSGELAPGELFLFIAYVLMIHRRAVRTGRAVARGGRILANGQRIAALLCEGSSQTLPPLRPLTSGLLLDGVCLRSSTGHRNPDRLGPIDMLIEPGSRTAVVGGVGAGKSSFLEVIAGYAKPASGRLLFDDMEVGEEPESLRTTVAYLPQDPHDRHASTRVRITDSEDPDSTENQKLLRLLGTDQVRKRLHKGVDQVVDGSILTPREQRAVTLGHLLMGKARIWVLDTPIATKRAKDRARLDAILDRADGRTLVVALDTPCLMERFTNVLVLRRGMIKFQGTPREWQQWKLESNKKPLET